jgi:hypothetical protein
MKVSVLLRLLRGPLTEGRLVGEVEVVETGERTVVRDVAQLVAYLGACAGGDGTTSESAAERLGEEER